MPSCIVPGCKSRKRSNPEKIHFFTVPSNSLRETEWKKAIRGRDVKKRDAVCEKHFHKSEILWEKHLLGPDGKILGVGRYKIPRLKVGSVPSIFPWTESAATTSSPPMTPKADEQGDPEPKLNEELNTPELSTPKELQPEQQTGLATAKSAAVESVRFANPENKTITNNKIVCQVARLKVASLPSQFPSTKTEKQGDEAQKLNKELNTAELGKPKVLQPEQQTVPITDKSAAVESVKFANPENKTITNNKIVCQVPHSKGGSLPSQFPSTKTEMQGDVAQKLNKELNTRPELGVPKALHQEQQIVLATDKSVAVETVKFGNPENKTNNGKIFYQVPRLKVGSLPCQFPSTKTEKQGDEAQKLNKELNTAELGKPKALQPEQQTVLVTNKSAAVGCVKSANVENGTINSKIHGQNPSEERAPTELCFLDIVNAEVNLPQGWVKLVTGCKGKKLVMFYVNETVEVEQSYNMFPLKNVVVKEDLSINIKVVGFLFNDQESLLPRSFSTVTELQDIIFKLHRLSVCCGVISSSECKMYQTNDTLHEDISFRWRHKNCSLLGVNQKICTRCKTTKTSLQRKLRASLKNNKRIDDKESRKALQAKYRRAFRMQQLNAEKIKSIQAENARLQSQLQQEKSQNLDELLKNKHIPQNYVLVIREMMEAAKHKDVKGHQYSEEWRLVCLLLHTQSPSSYQFLRSNNYLPLPSLRTIHRWIRENSQESGNVSSSCTEETEGAVDLINP